MALGLARSGVRVLAVGHIAGDAEQLHAEVSQSDLRGKLVPMLADLRRPTECNRVVDMCRAKFGRLNILINCAGLTFTYIWPGLYRRPNKPKFWEVTDDIVQAVMDTNFVAADQMARRAAPFFVKQGWGRIINVTTRLETMNR